MIYILSSTGFRVYCTLSTSPYSWPTFTSGIDIRFICKLITEVKKRFRRPIEDHLPNWRLAHWWVDIVIVFFLQRRQSQQLTMTIDLWQSVIRQCQETTTTNKATPSKVLEIWLCFGSLGSTPPSEAIPISWRFEATESFPSLQTPDAS